MNNCSDTPKIIVITPVKNEEGILDRFLAVTSQFADYIIIADQNSSDRSRIICQAYPKVVLIENNSASYDEASRQILLLNTARELVIGPKIILALDADEILAANGLKAVSWQSMLKAKPGTVLYFEKPELYLSTSQCIRYDVTWPIGYVDDGVEHKPKKIHSIRIPIPDYADRLHLHDIKILHYALTKMRNQAAKIRLYSVLENVLNTPPSLFARRRAYASNRAWTKDGKLEKSNVDWFSGWEEIGIDMHSIIEQNFSWQDFEVLKYFNKYGVVKFWLDDIWNFDWEACRLYGLSQGMKDIPLKPIKYPPRFLRYVLLILDKLYLLFIKLKKI